MKYGIIGASGKMGKEIQTAMQEAGHSLVFTLDENGEEATGTPQVIIDFSLPSALDKVIESCKKYNAALVSGTTGYTAGQAEQIKLLGKDVPVVQSYNYSVGVHLMLECIDLLKEKTANWDVEITETHHRFKKDKPSGTAKMMVSRLGKEAPVSSLRLGSVVGEHTISFGAPGEVVSITHSALSRRTFAEGVVKAAEFVLNRQPGYYTFTDVLS